MYGPVRRHRPPLGVKFAMIREGSGAADAPGDLDANFIHSPSFSSLPTMIHPPHQRVSPPSLRQQNKTCPDGDNDQLMNKCDTGSQSRKKGMSINIYTGEDKNTRKSAKQLGKANNIRCKCNASLTKEIKYSHPLKRTLKKGNNGYRK